MCQPEYADREKEVFLTQSLLLFRSQDWMRPTRVREGSLLYSVTDSSGDLIRKHPADTPRILWDQMSGYPRPSKVDIYEMSLVHMCCVLD